MAEDWSETELAAAVDAYNHMARLEAEQKPYNKRQIYRDLAARHGRTEKAFEYRMQNISAVLDEMGSDWIPGLKPAGNVGANVRPRIIALLRRPAKIKRNVPTEKAAYKAKLPAMRDWLIKVARNGSKVRYGDVMRVFGVDRLSLRHAMDILGHQSDNRDEPIITALIVNKKTGTCSIGIAKEFGVQDDDAERQRLYEFWRRTEHEPTKDADNTLEVRAARFASIEVRPEQAAFRRLVFAAFKGRCAVSGCDVSVALDAAHLVGRDWRLGHNTANDGILLRKDLHALYDAKVLSITDVGSVDCSLEHYQQFHGLKVTMS